MRNIKLFKDNKVANEYTIQFSKFKRDFFKWVKLKENKNQCEIKPFTNVLAFYINFELLSSIEDADKKILESLLRDDYLQILDDMDIK